MHFCWRIKSVFVLALLSVGMGCTFKANVSQANDEQHKELAYQYLAEESEHFGLTNPRKELLLTKVEKDSLGMVHLRFQQMASGIPVWSGELRVHINAQQKVYFVDGKVVPGITTINSEPRLSKHDVLKKIKGSLGESVKIKEPVLYVLADGDVRLVYQVEVMQALIRKWLFVDAMTGDVLKTLSGSPTLN